jgi:hypothetical protein
MTTAVLEGINSIAQPSRSRARGYRNPSTFKTMFHLLAGRLQSALPSLNRLTKRTEIDRTNASNTKVSLH